MDTLHTKDLQERIDELEILEAELLDAREAYEALMDEEDVENETAEAQERLDFAEKFFSEEDENELVELRNLVDEVGDEWNYGETLIHVDSFPEYVEELCRDCGFISPEFPDWIEVDWDATAENVSMDYSLVKYKGQEYYVRA